MSAENTIRAVLFDAGGVLVLPDPRQLVVTLAPFGGSEDPDLYVRGHYAACRAMYEHSLDYDDWVVYYTTMAVHVGIPAERLSEAGVAASGSYVPELWSYPRPEALTALRALADADVPIGVVSNAEGQIERVLAERGICQVGVGSGVPVVCVVDSHLVGFAKPDPRIFEPAISALQAHVVAAGDPPLRRDAIAYVGDTYRNDVVGARAAGLRPFHLDPYGDHHDADHERIASITELVAMVVG